MDGKGDFFPVVEGDAREGSGRGERVLFFHEKAVGSGGEPSVDQGDFPVGDGGGFGAVGDNY
jgi:hypothetical protein